MTTPPDLTPDERPNLVAYLDGEPDRAAARALESKLTPDPTAPPEADPPRHGPALHRDPAPLRKRGRPRFCRTARRPEGPRPVRQRDARLVGRPAHHASARPTPAAGHGPGGRPVGRPRRLPAGPGDAEPAGARE